jgi:hypothetical protein
MQRSKKTVLAFVAITAFVSAVTQPHHHERDLYERIAHAVAEAEYADSIYARDAQLYEQALYARVACDVRPGG